MNFTIRLKELRESKKLSQEQLARALNVHRSYITKIEKGERLPGRDLLIKIANKFGCSVEDLIMFENSK